MNFNSRSFLIFLPAVVLLYWLLPHKFRWVLLLAASYFFYMSWNAWLIVLIMTTTVTAYVTSILISRTQKTALRRLWLAVALVICLGLLIFFKYINFILESAPLVVALTDHRQLLQLIHDFVYGFLHRLGQVAVGLLTL